MRSALGACPPLFIMQHPHMRIRDVLLSLADVDPRAWVEERHVHRARTAAPPHGAHVVADLHIDAATPVSTVWYELARELNLRMAIPAMCEAGNSALWLGLHGYATLGYEVTPRAKQSRAISMLSDISVQRDIRNDDYAQLRGLLQHLVPFSLGTCAMYHMHAPATAAAQLGPTGWISADDEMLEQVAV